MIPWITRILAPVWREIVLAAGALIAILALLRRAERGGERNERLRQKEQDHETASKIRDSVRDRIGSGRLRVDDTRGFRDRP
jgi:membrane protein implicated in regulation of membrane protease activity